MIRFQYKDFILLFAAIALLAILFAWILQWKKKVRKRIGDQKLVNELTRQYSGKLFLAKFIIVALAFAMGILAVMNPRKPGGSDSRTRQGIDVVIAMDVSKSMLATDMAPSRLDRAKQFVNKLMDQMPDDRIALVLFAGKAYLQMPLTVDHGAARMFVSTAGPESVPAPGSVVEEALTMSATVFDPNDNRFKSVILITDGEDHGEQAVNTAKDLAEEGVMINTVGIGTPEGTTIIDPLTGSAKLDEAGSPVISKLNEADLQAMANVTNGVYSRLESSDESIKLVKAQLSQIEKKAFSDVTQMSFTYYFTWLLAAMLVLLVLESLLPERKRSVSA